MLRGISSFGVVYTGRCWRESVYKGAEAGINRTPKDTGYFLGCGYWTHSNAEICPLATRGRPKRVGTGIPGLIVSPRQEHSQKPDEARGRIVRLCGDVPRAELFARQKTAGWSAWGNEVDCDFSFPQR